ncbi:MAG: single-stranded DNA-binding protein, partial [Anaerolineae bacterium]|nr:single-stranded DNA-binding protein [Anaerolineae bacterium]
MNYQRLIFVGNVAADPKRLTSKKGDVTYTSFRVGVSEGKEGSVFFPVTAFGKLSELVDKFVTKGKQVLVEGRVTVSQEGRFSVVADR